MKSVKENRMIIFLALGFSVLGILANDLLYRTGLSDGALSNPLYLIIDIGFLLFLVIYTIRRKTLPVLAVATAIIALVRLLTFLLMLMEVYEPKTAGDGFLWGLGFAFSPIIESVAYGAVFAICGVILLVKRVRKKQGK